MEFRSIHTLETAENVHIKVELAGLANRVFAFIVDALIMMGLMALVVIFALMIAAANHSTEWSSTLIPLGMFVVFFGYHLFQEWLWNGKSVGKVIFHIRVVRDNGQPIGFWEAFGRNLLRVVDVYLSGLGLLVMMFNSGEKRCGDFVAGTIVINDLALIKAGSPPVAVPVSPTPDPGALLGTVEQSSGQDPAAVGLRLTPEEAELLKAYRSRRSQWFAWPREVLGRALGQYFAERWHQPLRSEDELDHWADQAEANLR